MTLRVFLFLTVLLLLHLLILMNVQFTLWPEMAVYPYLINNGYLLYKEIVNPYPPLFNYFLSGLTLTFGYNYFLFQIFTWLIITVIDLIIFFITWTKLNNLKASLSALLFFAVFSLPFGVNGLWYDLAVVPFCLMAIYYFSLYVNEQSKSKFNALFWGALSLTIATFIKQQSAVLAVPLLFIVFTKINTIQREKILTLFRICIVSLLPPLIFLSIFMLLAIINGTFSEYLYYSFKFPLIASSFPGYVLLPTTRQVIFLLCLILIYLLVIRDKKNQNYFLLSGILLFAFAYPRFDYFHLIPSLAFLSILIGYEVNNYKKGLLYYLPYALVIFLLLIFFIKHVAISFQREDRFFDRNIYQSAAVVKNIIGREDKVYIQNSPDQLLVLTNLNSIRPWAIQFPWYFENTGLQEKTVAALTKESPKYVLSQKYSEGDKYGLGSYRPTVIARYIDQNYQDYQQVAGDLWIKIKK